VGLFWPCHISAPEVLANARRRLFGRFAKSTAPNGPSAAVTAVEQSSGLGKEL
jgi:hypothetical protein